MSRPTKYSEDRAAEILAHLEAGATRTAACLAVGVSTDSLLRWVARFAAFAALVARAEAAAELRYTAVLEKAASGYDQETLQRTVRTVFRTRKITTTDPTTKQKTIVEEPVALEEVTQTTTVGHEFDWKAALEWLRRRRRAEWGDALELRKLPDDALIRILEEDAARGSLPEGPADPDALRPG